jgi:hypothetical protein
MSATWSPGRLELPRRYSENDGSTSLIWQMENKETVKNSNFYHYRHAVFSSAFHNIDDQYKSASSCPPLAEISALRFEA